MRFVENHNFVASADRGVAHHFAQFADLVNAAIGSGVDFEHIERIAGSDRAAEIALVARSGRGAFHAIKALGENARGSRFSHAARAGENVCVREAVLANGVFQRLHHVALSDDLLETLRAPFARDDLIGHFFFLSAPRAGRNFGYSAAHEADPLPLLPSGPGGVRGESSHKARSSADWRTRNAPRKFREARSQSQRRV